MENGNFSFQHFRFHLDPKVTLHMPVYNKGNVIRGGFGSAFRRIVCHGNCRDPESCDLRFVCPYTAVFNPFVPEGSDKISKNRDIPRPFVIKPPLETKETYLPGEKVSFDLIVVGKAKDYLPYFIVTFKELCHVGLGRTRAPCELVSVEAVSSEKECTVVYSSDDNLVRPPRNDIRWPDLLGHNFGGGNGAKTKSKVKLEFLTPTTLKVDGRLVQKPGFSHILKRLRDRINGLSYFYCGQGLDIDFKGFGTEAEKVTTVQDSTRWVDSSRYSRRRGVSQDLSGFVGEVAFEGEMGSFLPYLMLGEYLHVGKNAVFGNGWYQIAEIE